MQCKYVAISFHYVLRSFLPFLEMLTNSYRSRHTHTYNITVMPVGPMWVMCARVVAPKQTDLVLFWNVIMPPIINLDRTYPYELGVKKCSSVNSHHTTYNFLEVWEIQICIVFLKIWHVSNRELSQNTLQMVSILPLESINIHKLRFNGNFSRWTSVSRLPP